MPCLSPSLELSNSLLTWQGQGPSNIKMESTQRMATVPRTDQDDFGNGPETLASPREQFSYAEPQLRRQDYYAGPLRDMDEDEARSLLAELVHMFGADHDFYAPLPPTGLPGIAKGNIDPYRVEWEIINVGLRYLGHAARNEGRGMHNRWQQAREIADELRRQGETSEFMRQIRREEKKPAKALVYFIAAQSGPIKIGMAANPKARLAGLQTSHHERLELLATCRGGANQERLYHYQFKEHRLKGEWFKRVPEIEAEIARLATPHKQEK